MSRAELNIGDRCKQYVKTVMGECIGCIECEVAQDLSGEKILVIKDSHGGVGYLSNGATGPLKNMRDVHQDERCTLPDDQKRGLHHCNSCWMKNGSAEAMTP